MKHLYILLMFIIIHLNAFGTEIVKVATFTFDKDMFHIEKLDNGTTYIYATEWSFDYTFDGVYKPTGYMGGPSFWVYYGERYMPCVNFTWLFIPINKTDNYVSFSMETTEELIADDCTLAYNPYSVSGPDDPNNIPYEEYNTPPMIYELKNYPDSNVEMTAYTRNQWEDNPETGRNELSNDRYIVPTVWPFRYDALNKKLYLLTNITLNITFRQDDVTTIQDVKKSDNTQSSIYDLQGRKLTAPPTKGMYIKDRIKTLAR